MKRVICILVCAVLLLTGCSAGVSKEKYDALEAENAVLREQLRAITGTEPTDFLEENSEISSNRSSEVMCNAFEKPPFDKPIEINTENGSVKVTFKNVHTVSWDSSQEGMKFVTIQVIIENIDFKCSLGNYINDYMLNDYGLTLVDSDGLNLNYYKISTVPDGEYDVWTNVPEASKKRIALPFLVPEECKTVFVKVNDQISEGISIE